MPPISGSDPSVLHSQSDIARCGASRAGTHSARVFVKIDGTHRAGNRPSPDSRVIVSSLRTNGRNGRTPNTLACRVLGFTPQRLSEVIVTLGSVNRHRREFGGVILGTTQRCLSETEEVYDLNCVAFGWQLYALVTGHFTGTADAIATELVQTYAPQFSTVKIQSGLPTVSGGISFTNVRLSVALDRLAERVGATWMADYQKRILFGTSAFLFLTNPRPLTTGLKTFFFDDFFSVQREQSQRLTRVHCEGGGGTALAEIAAGETSIPVSAATAEWYGDEGGEVIIGDSQQIVTYAERFEGGAGGLVGPGARPSSLLTLEGLWGSNLDNNATYKYAFTHVTSAPGETLESPQVSFTTGGPVAPPTGSYSVQVQSGTPIFGTGVYVYGLSWEFPGGLRSAIGVFEAVLTNGATAAQINLSLIPQPSDPGATHINIWRSTLNGYISGDPTSVKLLATIAVGTTTYADTTVDGSLGAAGHTTATAVCRKVRIRGISAGPATTTDRNLWRTEGGGAQLKALDNLGDNSTGEFIDHIADGSLGANIHVVDTSGLTQPTGVVAAGSTSIPVTGSFPDDGWAIAGGQVVRYGSRSASALNDIPATGVGSLQAPLNYNATIKPAPQLRGISSGSPSRGSITNTIPNGAAINLWVTVDNLSAQAEVAAEIDPNDESNGLAGIIADVISDQRINRDEAIARATARLDTQDDEHVTVTVTSWDLNALEVRELETNLDVSSPATTDTLRIQEVESRWLDSDPPTFPVRSVTASSKRFTFEELLQRARET